MTYEKTVDVTNGFYDLEKLISYFVSRGYIYELVDDLHQFSLTPKKKSKGMRKIPCSITLLIQEDMFYFSMTPNLKNMIATLVEKYFNLEIDTAVSIMLYNNSLEDEWKKFHRKDRIELIIFIAFILVIISIVPLVSILYSI